MASLLRAITCSGWVTPSWLLCIIPWLQLSGGLLAFLLIALFGTIHSELGHQISAGESPALAWARIHVAGVLGGGLAYLAVASALQALALRQAGRPAARGMNLLAAMELVAVASLGLAFLRQWDGVVPWGHTLLQLSLLLQALVLLCRSGPHEITFPAGLRGGGHGLFLTLVFLLAAVPGYLDPSWHRLREHVQLDSGRDIFWSRVLPMLFSGVTGLWLGSGVLAILAGCRRLAMRPGISPRAAGTISFLPFLSIAVLFGAVGLLPLFQSMEWELGALRLGGAVPPLFLLLSGGGGALCWLAFRRLVPHAPGARGELLIGMAALAMGGMLLLPITWLLIRPGSGWRSRRWLQVFSLLGSLGLAYVVLYGNLFDPWFTVFSYLKGGILKFVAVVVAGILTMLIRESQTNGTRPSEAKTRWMPVAAACLAGVIPFAALERGRDTKVAVLQFNELSMVDATYARLAARVLGLEGWIRLGQNPAPRGRPEPWPHPWSLQRNGLLRLPRDFNLLVIVVDALRGDAFGSAGYHRDLTPFLDRWAREEAVSFRRAYSQGGGTFAAYPFLVGGRSRFTLYGAELHRENLYFKLSQAEGIRHVMVVKEFGPREIFPPDFPVIELGGPGARAAGRSVPAETVFGRVREAIGALSKGERFFAFLHLMDVHSVLWKKPECVDFGDTPRDLYDNNLACLDKALERFVTWLKAQGIYQRTVIVFTADHGEQFWEHGASLHGHTLYEEEIHIPLILLAHGVRGRVEDVPVLAADMAPTVAELAGYSVRPPYDDPRMGISLVPLLLGEERERYRKRDVVGRASFKRRYFLYRDWEWKLVYSADFDLLQLFNTARDPWERRNLLREEPTLAAELERELLGYLERIEGKSYRPLLSQATNGGGLSGRAQRQPRFAGVRER